MIRNLTRFALAVVLCSFAGFSVACTQDSAGNWHWGMMSKEDKMAKGDEMIQKGNSMKQDAMNMSASDNKWGMTKDQMMNKGDEMIRKGQQMKDEAAGM